jgi:hypothetical protein
MMSYKTLSGQPQSFLALTGLTNAEFGNLLPAFRQAYARAHPADRTAAGQPRQRWPGAGRRSALADDADKLLFVLVYLKTYPLQVVPGKLFDLSTSQATYWLHHLLPVLRSASNDLDALAQRDAGRLRQCPAEPGRRRLVIIDGTERRRQRPKRLKNRRRTTAARGRPIPTRTSSSSAAAASASCSSAGLSPAGPTTSASPTRRTWVIRRAPRCTRMPGFRAMSRRSPRAARRKKKPPGGALAEAAKRANRKLARIRVRVEHALAGVKRSRIVKDVFRNTKPGLSDVSMEVACGLHNVRVTHRSGTKQSERLFTRRVPINRTSSRAQAKCRAW